MSPFGAVTTSDGSLKCVSAAAGHAGHPEPHQHFAIGRQLDDLMPFRSVLARLRIGHPHVAVAIDVQAVRKHEQPRADALRRLAGRQIHQVDRRKVGAVAGVHAAAIDGPDLIARADFDAGGRAPRPVVGKHAPIADGRLIRVRKFVSRRDRRLREGTRAGQSDQDYGRKEAVSHYVGLSSFASSTPRVTVMSRRIVRPLPVSKYRER